MKFNIFDIIEKKASKNSLSDDELDFVINGYVNGDIPDYQMSALLMAIKINGLSKKEILKLVTLYVDSGEIIKYPSDIFVVDKHSTGGVGDKVSLILAPLATSMGLSMGKISGRGLGYTGGTIDKLEAIEGFNVEMSIDDFINNVKKHKLALIGQTDNLCIADKKIYSLRNASGTVSSLGLIVASIMSKKIASGSSSILIDLKSGSGGFFNDTKMEEEFSELVIEVGRNNNKDTRVVITNMNQPLGAKIGNLNELEEAIQTLKGLGEKDVNELLIYQAAILYTQVHKGFNFDRAKKLAYDNLNNNKALNEFINWMKFQGAKNFNINNKLHNPKNIVEIKADRDGFIDIINCSDFGMLAVELGVGRIKKDDVIDNHAGITLLKKQNSKVIKDEIIAKIYTSKKQITKEHIDTIKKLMKIVSKNPKRSTDIIIKYNK